MSTISAVFSSLFTASLILNAAFFVKLRKQSKARPKSDDLREFVADMARGEGLLRISRVDPNDVYLRSPGRYL